MKTVVTISRYWTNPKITTSISREGITMQMDMDDFVAALKKEIGSVTMIFTQKGIESKIDTAVTSVLEKIKEESVKVV